MKKNLILVPMALFALACALPALRMAKDNGVAFGVHTLAIGWLGIFSGVFAWYANPFFALGVLLSAFRKRIPATICAALAMPIALTVFNDIGRQLPGDEGNVTKTAIVRLLPGAYIWLASLVTLPFAAYFRK
jgi:hypothetical protein